MAYPDGSGKVSHKLTAKYLSDFENRMGSGNSKIDGIWDWGNVKNLGIFSYLLSNREGRNPSLPETIRTEMVEEVDNLVSISKTDAYGRILGESYNWGCNGILMRQTLILDIAHKISAKEDYNAAFLSALAHVFGANFYGRSYVTGLGKNPPLFPHDRRSLWVLKIIKKSFGPSSILFFTKTGCCLKNLNLS